MPKIVVKDSVFEKNEFNPKWLAPNEYRWCSQCARWKLLDKFLFWKRVNGVGHYRKKCNKCLAAAHPKNRTKKVVGRKSEVPLLTDACMDEIFCGCFKHGRNEFLRLLACKIDDAIDGFKSRS